MNCVIVIILLGIWVALSIIHDDLCAIEYLLERTNKKFIEHD